MTGLREVRKIMRNDLKRLLLIVILLVISVLIFSGCSKQTESEVTSEKPVFVKKEDVTEEIKALIYGSDGWIFQHPFGSKYVYAQAGYYLIRYNISKNSIDRVMDISKMTHFNHAINFSADGRYAVMHSNYEFFSYSPKSIYFVDFEESKVLFLAESDEDFTVNLLPKKLRGGFNEDRLSWDTDVQNLDKLNYEIVSEYNPTKGILWYAVNKAGKKLELTELRISLSPMGIDGIPCVAVSPDAIISIVPIENDPAQFLYLGYSKFIMIELSTGNVIQECAIIE